MRRKTKFRNGTQCPHKIIRLRLTWILSNQKTKYHLNYNQVQKLCKFGSIFHFHCYNTTVCYSLLGILSLPDRKHSFVVNDIRQSCLVYFWICKLFRCRFQLCFMIHKKKCRPLFGRSRHVTYECFFLKTESRLCKLKPIEFYKAIPCYGVGGYCNFLRSSFFLIFMFCKTRHQATGEKVLCAEYAICCRVWGLCMCELLS